MMERLKAVQPSPLVHAEEVYHVSCHVAAPANSRNGFSVGANGQVPIALTLGGQAEIQYPTEAHR